MKTVDEFLTVVQEEYQKQNQRAVQLFGTLQAIDGYDMGGGFKLLSNDGEIGLVKGDKRILLAKLSWASKCRSAMGCCCSPKTEEPVKEPLEQAFDDVGLFVDIEDVHLNLEKEGTVPLKGLVVSWFKSKIFGRNDLDAAAEYLFAYLASVKQRIRAR